MEPILTDEHGRPIERPERPGYDASFEERTAYLEAMYAYNDKITDLANRAFAKSFARGIKNG